VTDQNLQLISSLDLDTVSRLCVLIEAEYQNASQRIFS